MLWKRIGPGPLKLHHHASGERAGPRTEIGVPCFNTLVAKADEDKR